jgi:WD40-like Beta Propeller Repeat
MTAASFRSCGARWLVVLVSSACRAGEPEQGSEGTDACVAELAKAIGPEPELRGATWSPDGRRIAFSAWNGKQTRI